MMGIIFKIERYKWNKEYRVYVSNLGHFKDEHKKLIAPKVKQNGYLVIRTPYGFKLAHRLVMLTWRPIPNAEELTVDHLDHNKRNNELTNLEWVTEEENLTRAKDDFINLPIAEVTKNYCYYLYNSDGELLFKLKDAQQVVSTIKKYYFGDYKTYRSSDEELEEIIFEPEIVEEEKNQIIDMIKEINNTVKLELKDVSKGEN